MNILLKCNIQSPTYIGLFMVVDSFNLCIATSFSIIISLVANDGLETYFNHFSLLPTNSYQLYVLHIP